MSDKYNIKTLASPLPGYSVRESVKVKRMRLKVSLLGDVEVVIPRGFDRRRIAPFVARNEEWLRKTIARIEAQRLSMGEPIDALPETIPLRAIGEEWRVDYCRADARRFSVSELRSGLLTVRGATDDKEACKAALRDWVAGKARTHLVPWLRQVSDEAGLPFRSVAVRGQRTRWGSCSSSKIISINWKLLFLSSAVVRYLFIHELCHTIHLDHSRHYWKLVAEKEPAYKALDEELRKASHAVPLWVQYP